MTQLLFKAMNTLPIGPQPPLPQPSAALVLQPSGNLTAVSSAEFGAVLEQAIAQARATVIIDLLWVDEIDPIGITMLATGLQQAAEQGKTLCFQSLNYITWQAVNEAKQQALSPETNRNDCFRQDFADFLSRRHTKPQTPKSLRHPLRPSISYPNPTVILVRAA